MHVKSVVDSTQCTIAWYVGDNKVSHVKEKLNTRIAEKIGEHFDVLIQKGPIPHVRPRCSLNH